MDLNSFLLETEYIDYRAFNIVSKAAELFCANMSETEKAKIAYTFVRDEIPHSFDCGAAVITAKASDVLKYQTGICHAKANLLAALLRSQGIPAGFCFQHITLADDDSLGYCVHALNAVWIENRWIKLDARGNTNGIHARFSLTEPALAFDNRPQYDEYFWKGIFSCPHVESMKMLEQAENLQDILDGIPDSLGQPPNITED